MNALDATLLQVVNHFARRSYVLDTAVRVIVDLDLLKGGFFLAALSWFWFATGPNRARRREIVTSTLIAAFVAIVAGRALAVLLPFRIRPMQNPLLGFVQPFGAPAEIFRGWSAFPSDHAMLYATLATGVCFLSLPLGLALHAYAAVLIYAPRVYVGFHHPTDILGGAALGVLFGLVANAPAIRARLAHRPLAWSEVRPHAFYAVALLVAIQIATMFEDARTAAREGVAIARFAWCRVSPHPACDVNGAPAALGAPVPAAAPSGRELRRTQAVVRE